MYLNPMLFYFCFRHSLSLKKLYYEKINFYFYPEICHFKCSLLAVEIRAPITIICLCLACRHPDEVLLTFVHLEKIYLFCLHYWNILLWVYKPRLTAIFFQLYKDVIPLSLGLHNFSEEIYDSYLCSFLYKNVTFIMLKSSITCLQ